MLLLQLLLADVHSNSVVCLQQLMTMMMVMNKATAASASQSLADTSPLPVVQEVFGRGSLSSVTGRVDIEAELHHAARGTRSQTHRVLSWRHSSLDQRHLLHTHTHLYVCTCRLPSY